MIREVAYGDKSYKIYCLEQVLHWILGNPTNYSHDDEVEVRKHLWRVRPGDSVLDIGACFGSYTLPALADGAKFVWAFCPQGTGEYKESDILTKSLELNGWSDKCKIFESGLYSKTGFLNPDTQEFTETSEDLSKRIPVEPLDGWAQRELGPEDRIDWMKLDVEGAELEILKSGAELIKKFTPLILVENHREKIPTIEADVSQFLRELASYNEIGPIGYGQSVSHSLHYVEKHTIKP